MRRNKGRGVSHWPPSNEEQSTRVGADVRNVGQDAALADDRITEKLAELLVVADRELNVTRNDPPLAVVAGRIAGELEDLSYEVCRRDEERTQVSI